MKQLLITLTLLVLPSMLLAQERTLVGHHMESGGFGAPVLKLSQVRGQFAVFVGGRGGWIINHKFVIGGGAYGLASDVPMPTSPLRRGLEFGYGGFELEYIIASDNVIHATLMSLVGGGGIRIDNYGWWEHDGVFVLEPAGSIELNVTTFFRLGIGGGYRWVTDVNSAFLTNADMTEWFGSFAFKFGKF